jgi:hypothetical protein
MATRGFEFAYNLDGSPQTPLIRDWAVDGTGALLQGDVHVVNSDGQLAAITSDIGEVSAIIQQPRPASGAADGDLVKVAIVTPTQVWRCSMDATSTLAKIGYHKTIDVADANTIDADDLTNGSMCLVDTGTDDEGNVLAYVVFKDTTFGPEPA